MIWFLEFLIFAMTGILLVHSIITRSVQFTIIFWSAGAVMGLFREVALSKISEFYSYGDFVLTLGGIPFIFLLLWSNLSYVSWEWSNSYLGTEYFQTKGWDQHLPLIFLTMILAAFFFEALMSQFQLIHWQLDAMPKLWGNTPVLAPFMYGFTGVIFLKSLKLLWDKPGQDWPTVASKIIMVQPLLILVLMGLLFFANLFIILIFS
ncbi:MAG: hypothetical protein K9N35_02285 [Candidatus Marinimicrobia bacterium]|nr:hypothetical protein [Candidatus Neomarinimicrobiota bacterium]